MLHLNFCSSQFSFFQLLIFDFISSIVFAVAAGSDEGSSTSAVTATGEDTVQLQTNVGLPSPGRAAKRHRVVLLESGDKEDVQRVKRAKLCK